MLFAIPKFPSNFPRRSTSAASLWDGSAVLICIGNKYLTNGDLNVNFYTANTSSKNIDTMWPPRARMPGAAGAPGHGLLARLGRRRVQA